MSRQPPEVSSPRISTNKSWKECQKFYTRPDVVTLCLDIYATALAALGVDPDRVMYLEPSAGAGAFTDEITRRGWGCVSADLAPEAAGIIQADFLADDLSAHLPNEVFVVGNPPYGKRAKTALGFLDKAFTYSDTVGFILPIQFEKYLTQKHVRQDARLVSSTVLPDDSFTENGRIRNVRSVFQVWTLRPGEEDIRIRTAPPVSHPDFTMNIYNCTQQSRWVLTADFDFAVLRQGWADFTPVDHGTALCPRKQWMTFSSDDPIVVDRLRTLDFNELGRKNTSVRGFGKADVVSEYTRLFGP